MPDETLTIQGLDELQEKLIKMADLYPDKTMKLLRKSANKIRKEVTTELKAVAKSDDADGKRPLTKNTSYKVQVQGYGAGQIAEISAKSPHFHLVEHGHVLKTHNRETIGFVPGYHIMESTVRRHRENLPKEAEDMLKALIREARLR